MAYTSPKVTDLMTKLNDSLDLFQKIKFAQKNCLILESTNLELMIADQAKELNELLKPINSSIIDSIEIKTQANPSGKVLMGMGTISHVRGTPLPILSFVPITVDVSSKKLPVTKISANGKHCKGSISSNDASKKEILTIHVPKAIFLDDPTKIIGPERNSKVTDIVFVGNDIIFVHEDGTTDNEPGQKFIIDEIPNAIISAGTPIRDTRGSSKYDHLIESGLKIPRYL